MALSSAPCRTIVVELGEKSYPIVIGAGNLSQLGPLLLEQGIKLKVRD